MDHVQSQGGNLLTPGVRRGRLLLNVVTGGEADEQARFGDHLTKAGRHERRCCAHQ